MQEEKHEKGTFSEGTVKHEVLKDAPVHGGFGVICEVGYLLQVVEKQETEKVESGVSHLSHIRHEITNLRECQWNRNEVSDRI
jgi:hypothetical protein